MSSTSIEFQRAESMEYRPEVADHVGLREIPPAENRKEVFLLNESLKKSTCPSGDFNLFEVLLEVSVVVVPALIASLFLAILSVTNGTGYIIDLIW
jgi:hypothetical protein